MKIFYGFMAVLACSLIVFSGCRSSDSPAPTSIVRPDGKDALWRLSLKTVDELVEFSDTALRIAVSANGYNVAWMSDSFNGTAGFDTNTFTVTMNINHSSGALGLFGTLHNNNYMTGGGTIDGYQGSRVVTWHAKRD